MQNSNQLSVKISSVLTEKTKPGTVEVKLWTKQEQLRRAAKYGGICWGLALLAVPLPIVHFILVPSFLLAGPIAAVYFLKQSGMVLGGSGECPECNKTIPISKASNQFPLSEVCQHCRRNLKVSIEA